MQAVGQLTDGDAGFTGVNDRVHPSQLPAGMVAGATNLRFEYGDGRARWAVNGALWGHVSQMGGTPLAVGRWYEPETAQEALVIATDGVRTDGGRGRIWRVLAGGSVRELDLDGHDVWGACQFVPARSGLLLLRSGNLRAYISQSQLTAGSANITVNADVFTDLDLVLVKRASGSLPAPLVDNTQYWLKRSSATVVQLCTDPAGASPIVITVANTGQFYIERQAGKPGAGGNGANVLLLEPAWDAGRGTYATAWDSDFKTVPREVSASIANAATEWLAENHRFANGARVQVKLTDAGFDSSQYYYVEVSDNYHVHLHGQQETALLGTASGRSTASAGSAAGQAIRPAGYSAQPMVPLRDGVYFKNRLVGLNGNNNVAVSDPGDFLHFTPFTGALTAALGNGDPLTTIIPLGEDTLLLMTESQVLGITGLNTDSASWRLVELTREYGCLAPRSAAQVGKDVWFLSRAGVISVVQTEFGEQQGVAVPVSQPMARKFNEIDWRYASQACAAWFGNKYLLAVPMINQTGTPVNNGLFVYNFLTQAWDGFWSGAALKPVQFARFKVGGAERLAYLNSDGSVLWFTEGDMDLTVSGTTAPFTSVETDITTQLVTRGYTGGNPRQKQWVEGELVHDTLDATWSATAITEGYNQSRVYQSEVTKDPTKYFRHGDADFDNTQSTRANDPYREDYGVTPTGLDVVDADAVYNAEGYYQLIAEAGTYTLTLGNATTVSEGIDVTEAGSSPAGTILSSGTVEDPGSIYFWGTPGASVTATLVEADGGLAIPDEGVPLDAHQTYLKRLGLKEQSRSLQIQLDNTSGSARWRSLYVCAVKERGD
jgi:hypothetical protein